MTMHECGGTKVAVLSSTEMVTGAASLLDLLADISYHSGCRHLVVEKCSLPEGFFDLSTGIAGELLQKCSNYRFSLAIAGDFSRYRSKSLADFIRECNREGRILFVPDVEEGLSRLTRQAAGRPSQIR